MNRSTGTTRRALLGLGLAVSALATLGADWGSSWTTVQQSTARVTAIEASFVQAKHMKILLRPFVSRGKFRFAVPAELRWEFESPLRSLLVLQKGRVERFLWDNGRYRPDASAKLDALQVVLGEITGWFRGRFSGSTTFTPTLKPGSPSQIVLTPKQPALARFIQEIVLTLGTTPGVIQKVEIRESATATTILEFVDVKVTTR
jgi:outer membrane lipoprotein carrier protein